MPIDLQRRQACSDLSLFMSRKHVRARAWVQIGSKREVRIASTAVFKERPSSLKRGPHDRLQREALRTITKERP